MIELCETIPIDGLTLSLIQVVFHAIETALQDYETDDRGDVGSWVRREALVAGERFIQLLSNIETGLTSASSYPLVGQKVVVRHYGKGTIIDQQGEGRCHGDGGNSDHQQVVVHVRFNPDSFGSVYFQPRGIGLLPHTSVVTDTTMHQSLDDQPFVCPNLEQRRQYLTDPSSAMTTTIDRSSSATAARGYLTPDMMRKFMCHVMKQLSEKLDTVRETAGGVLYRILWRQDPTMVRWIPDRPHMQVIFPQTLKCNFANASETFPLLMKALMINEYMPSIIAGLIISVGGLTESVVKSSRQALIQWFQTQLKAQRYGLVSRVSFTLLELFATYRRNDRVIVPLMKTFAILLDLNLFDCLHRDGPEFGLALYQAVCDEVQKCHDFVKLSASIKLFIGLLPSEPHVVQRTLKGLLVLLGHKFPRVRTCVAEQLYTRLLIHEDILGDDSDRLDQVLEILTQTKWENRDLTQVRAAREPLYRLLLIGTAGINNSSTTNTETEQKTAPAQTDDD